MKHHLVILLATALMLATGCKHNSYDSGDGELSYMRADFTEAHTVASKQMDYAVTDEGDKVVFAHRYGCDWATKADSTYRSLVYYNKVDGMNEVSVVTITNVPVLHFKTEAKDNKPENKRMDPVVFESAWLSKNRKWINIGFAIKTGQADTPDSKQVIGCFCDEVKTLSDGTKEYHLSLYHNQNNVPEYYSSRMFASIPTDGMSQGDKIIVNIMGYNGLVTKEFTL